MSDPRTERPAYVCSHVFAQTSPILLVSHADGDWQFLCGAVHMNEEPRLIGINHVLERDSTLAEVMDLPIDWESERISVGGAWTRSQVEKSQ